MLIQPRQRRPALPLLMLAGFALFGAPPATARQLQTSAGVIIENAAGFGVAFNQQRQVLTGIFLLGQAAPPQALAIDTTPGSWMPGQSSAITPDNAIVVLADQALSVVVSRVLLPDAELANDQTEGRVVVLAQFN